MKKAVRISDICRIECGNVLKGYNDGEISGIEAMKQLLFYTVVEKAFTEDKYIDAATRLAGVVTDYIEEEEEEEEEEGYIPSMDP